MLSVTTLKFLSLFLGIIGVVFLIGNIISRIGDYPYAHLFSDKITLSMLFIYGALILSLLRDNKILREKK